MIFWGIILIVIGIALIGIGLIKIYIGVCDAIDEEQNQIE